MGRTLGRRRHAAEHARSQVIARQILKEIRARLQFLVDVGLDYLTLDRISGSLSGGESQRIRLATQIGSALMGVLYICDEPSIGLHPVDSDRLIATLVRLRDLGNTVLIVEHDEAMMRAADWIIDMGPGAGVHGGHVVAEGTSTSSRRPRTASPAPTSPGAAKSRCPSKDAARAMATPSSSAGANENNLRRRQRRDPPRQVRLP